MRQMVAEVASRWELKLVPFGMTGRRQSRSAGAQTEFVSSSGSDRNAAHSRWRNRLRTLAAPKERGIRPGCFQVRRNSAADWPVFRDPRNVLLPRAK